MNFTDGVDTALIVACEKGNETIVKMLLENGADVNVENCEGRTALYAAVRRGHAGFKKSEIQEGVTKFTSCISFWIFSLHQYGFSSS